MREYIVWWALAALLVGAELLTGTFYLLAIGLAFAVGGVTAWFGADLQWQLAIAAVTAVAGTAAAHRWRTTRAQPSAMDNPDLGQEVRVETWRSDGRARVSYRGSQWDAEVQEAATRRQERMYIADVRGNVLVLTDRRPAR